MKVLRNMNAVEKLELRTVIALVAYVVLIILLTILSIKTKSFSRDELIIFTFGYSIMGAVFYMVSMMKIRKLKERDIEKEFVVFQPRQVEFKFIEGDEFMKDLARRAKLYARKCYYNDTREDIYFEVFIVYNGENREIMFEEIPVEEFKQLYRVL